ncbi:uncharacterized protein LOC121237789 isoform X1 [Juglans microcarpa x Juglans regia]|uniref:uncharacterized protein LOC121237789 isoform X1 n=1 Tax=Juglans microcarpa x Juglans regia TaxID=2249226 RepID=UPI001B7F4211|nr:uncharacterized protein LOC121237789 isoform X1 [Juglans microcarpa x Juglans regia]
METADDSNCDIIEDDGSVSFQNQTHVFPNPQSESDVVKSSSDAVSRGLSSTLATVIRDFDSRAEDALRSQDQLSSALHRLTRELDQLLEDAPLPFIMQHAAKISGVRKRVSSLNSVLKSIQHRFDNIDRMLSMGVLHEKMGVESSGQH